VLGAILSLTVARMLPVFLGLGGMNCVAIIRYSWAGSARAAGPASCLHWSY
jgi:hypothetical protein